MNGPSSREVAAATRTLTMLHQQTDAARAELLALRQEVARVERDFSATRASQLMEANEQLVLAALRAQALADIAKRRADDLAPPGPVAPPVSVSGRLAHAEYQTRVQDLRQANEQLVKAALNSQELGASAEQAHGRQITFLAMAAHELRNPLLPLRLAAELLTRARTEERLLAVQTTIRSQVAHMSRLIGDLLDGSRVSTGKFRLERTMVDMNSMFDLAIDTCQPAMDARRQRFTRVACASPISVYADPVRMVQILGNLLENASKYTPEGGAISLEAVMSGDAMTVTVSDSGIGITPQTLPHVFELFTQDEHAALHNHGGLGIGLAVVRELVEAHGGSVTARSAGKDLGSQFTVTLPLAAA